MLYKDNLMHRYKKLLEYHTEIILEEMEEYKPYHIKDNFYAFRIDNKDIVFVKEIENNLGIKYKKGFYDFRKHFIPKLIYYDRVFEVITSDDKLIVDLIRTKIHGFPYVDFFWYEINGEHYKDEKEFLKQVDNILIPLEAVMRGVI